MVSEANSVSDNQACIEGCGACCIAPQISSPIPGMPLGKPAGVACIQLDENKLCKLFGLAERPAVCEQFKPQREMCGNGAVNALRWLKELEQLTAPS